MPPKEPREFKHWTKNRAEKSGIADHPKFKHLVLPRGTVKSNGRVLRIDHAGHLQETPIRNRHGTAIAVIRDPVKKERVIVVRKRNGTSDPFGGYALKSLWHNDEEHLGQALLSTKWGKVPSGHLLSLGVRPFTTRKARSLTPKAVKAMKDVERFLDGGSFAGLTKYVSESPKTEFEHLITAESKRRQGLHKQGELDDSLAPAPFDYFLRPCLDSFLADPASAFNAPSELRTYDYRRKRLATFLTELIANEAKDHGLAELTADFYPGTTGRFMPRYGWEKLTSSPHDARHKRVLLEELPEL